MEMQVETYDMLETLENEIQPVDDESTAIIEELGLQGQKELINDNGDRQAYNVLTEQQRFICANLFPTFTELKNYNVGPIPYRVLKEAKVAKEHFKTLYVLHEAPSIVKDPVLVGSNQEYYFWHDGTNKYHGLSLIARWGTALDSWEVLFEKAKQIMLQTTKNSLYVLKSEIENAVKLIEQNVTPTNKEFNMATICSLMPYKIKE